MMEKGFEDFGFGKSRWAAAGGDDGGVEVVVELAEEGDEADVVDLEKPATQFRIVGPETAAYSGSVSDVTRILEAAGRGDPKAANELLPLVYDELRRLAAAKMAHERPDQTLQPTALVHEAWLRLTGNAKSEWNGRVHFFGAAAEAMRHPD